MDKREKAFVELEMSRYLLYKKEIEVERERILNMSPLPPDGMPRGNSISNPTESKAIKLIESTAILFMERVVFAIDRVLERCDDSRRQIFKMCYIQGHTDWFRMCDDMNISIETFRRYKRDLIESVAGEMGIFRRV